MYRTGKFRQDTFDDDSVELAQHQPLRTSGGTRDRSYAFRREAPRPDILERARSGLEQEWRIAFSQGISPFIRYS